MLENRLSQTRTQTTGTGETGCCRSLPHNQAVSRSAQAAQLAEPVADTNQGEASVPSAGEHTSESRSTADMLTPSMASAPRTWKCWLLRHFASWRNSGSMTFWNSGACVSSKISSSSPRNNTSFWLLVTGQYFNSAVNTGSASFESFSTNCMHRKGPS